MKVIITEIQNNGSNVDLIIQIFQNSGTWVGFDFVTGIALGSANSDADVIALLKAAVQSYATTHSYTLDGGILFTALAKPGGLVNAPLAAIADSPADAVTNYNVVTTLLGNLTSAVNTANGKQNAIATQLNTLLAELRTLGLIS